MKFTRSLSLVTAFLALCTLSVQAQEWKLDRNHSTVGFSVRHMLISKVSGNFTDFDATLNYDPANLANSSFEFVIQAASITTSNEKRDGHLRSGDFFLVDSFPQITFKSTEIIPGEGENFRIVGDMTIRGVTLPVTFEATRNGVLATPRGERAGFSATGKIKRMDFGVKWDKALETGGLVVSDEVTINVDVAIVKNKPEVQG